MQQNNIAPFYVGQKVVAIDAVTGSSFKNGQSYIVSAVECKLGNKNHPIGSVTNYWYIGIVGFADGGAHFRPGIFAPLTSTFQSISFSKVMETELTSVN